MATATIVLIPDRYTCRGITFLPNGQQMSLGLPKGEYDVVCECNLTYSDLGKTKMGRACMLVNIDNGEKWYVGVEIGKWLTECHLRP